MAEQKRYSVKTLSISKVIPTDSPSQFTLPFTFMDRVWLQIKPTSRLFFYELSEPNTDIFVSKLKHSLSVTLKHYLPLAGNLTWPLGSNLPVFQYNDGDGIFLTIAETQADFDYLSGDVFRESAEILPLLPDFPSSETLIPAMTMQITLFLNRGFSVGYVVHHAVMDGKSTSMFIHSWAYICKNGDTCVLPLELTPSFDRTFVEQHKELEKIFPRKFGPLDPEKTKTLPTFDISPPLTKMMLGTFKLTRENIEALKNKVKTNYHSTTRVVSTFTVTSAYVAICLTKAKRETADTTTIGLSVDSRLRLDPPLPSTYFGSCVIVSGRERDTKDFLAKDGFITAVNAISEALTGLNEGVLKVVERVNKSISSSVMNKKSSVGFAIGGSPRFELYKVDFGWGKPVKVEMVSIIGEGGRAIYLSDNREGNGGIEVGIALEEQETEAFVSEFIKGIDAL